MPQSCMKYAWQPGKCFTDVIIFLFLIQVLFRVAFALLSLPSEDFAIHRHQGPSICNNGSSLLDLSLGSYTVLMIEMQDESGS